MKFLTVIFLVFALGYLCPAQSGRVKTPDEPATERPRTAKAKPTPTPRPTPAATPKPVLTDDDGVITIESVLIPIPVSVIDENGLLVPGLQLKDFDLTVDEKPAVISDLSYSDTPVRLALLFDNSASLTSARDFEVKAATKFLRRVLRPDRDQAALYSVATTVNLEQPLTSNVNALTSAIENLPPPDGATALFDAIVDSGKYLSNAEGRRVIVIVSDGEDTLSDIENTLERVVRSVQTRSCQIFVVKTTDFENYKKTGSRGGNANLMNLTAERRMQELAKQTGGDVYSPLDEHEMDAAFARISNELSQQYILSYYPEDKTLNSDFHSLAIKVKTRPNLTVRTRKGYYVPRKR
jgi:Ca-activated chloride channel family protein